MFADPLFSPRLASPDGNPCDGGISLNLLSRRSFSRKNCLIRNGSPLGLNLCPGTANKLIPMGCSLFSLWIYIEFLCKFTHFKRKISGFFLFFYLGNCLKKNGFGANSSKAFQRLAVRTFFFILTLYFSIIFLFFLLKNNKN